MTVGGQPMNQLMGNQISRSSLSVTKLKLYVFVNSWTHYFSVIAHKKPWERFFKNKQSTSFPKYWVAYHKINILLGTVVILTVNFFVWPRIEGNRVKKKFDVSENINMIMSLI